MVDKIQITQQRKDELEQELEELKTVKRPAILEKLSYAKSLGDLSENAEYHSARESQGKNEDRIKEIESILKNAEIVEKTDSDIAQITSTVVVQKEGDSEKREFILVSHAEADTASGKLSVESPIGAALVGTKTGDVATVETPAGKTQWNIIEVK